MVSDPSRTDDGVRRAADVARSVTDPELPFLTLADLGILRDVRMDPTGAVEVDIAPTYSGCPAMGAIRRDVVARLHRAGFDRVGVRTVLDPPWTSDWITAEGRAQLARHGISPPGPAGPGTGEVPLRIGPARHRATCPQCGSPDTVEQSRFGSTACKSLQRCRTCGEPFERFKEI